MTIKNYIIKREAQINQAYRIERNIKHVRSQLDKPIADCRSDSYKKSDPLYKLLCESEKYLVANVGRESLLAMHTEFNILELKKLLSNRMLPEDMYNYISNLTVLQFIFCEKIYQKLINLKYADRLQEHADLKERAGVEAKINSAENLEARLDKL